MEYINKRYYCALSATGHNKIRNKKMLLRHFVMKIRSYFSVFVSDSLK